MDERARGLHGHIAGLRRYAVALLGNATEADDLVQECLARALGRVGGWGDVRNARAYLFRILHNLYADRVAQQRRNGTSVPLENVSPQLSVPAQQDSRLALQDLSRALRKLPPEQSEVLLLIGLEGMSYQDAAKALNVPIGTVMSRLARARATLRRLTEGTGEKTLRRVK